MIRRKNFYEDLEEVCNRIPRLDMVIIMGGFNARQTNKKINK
jgi:hypothetical protein